MREPESMDECVYFTNRAWEKGKARAWCFKKECPKCHNALMGKPVEDGKVKIRAEEYICPKCGYTEEKQAHEASLKLSVVYTCPHCSHEGEIETEYKRKSFEGVPSYVFACGKCSQKIGITKKMKAPKKKGAASAEVDED